MAAVIRKLDETVVNRIAAGEVIQRPANALKELIENSLDAKATKINVTVKDGGMKLLQIQDNGCGIRKEDFDIVCERFTTSKLKEFDDLKSIGTFGFRGEALASISHVAHLTIVSKTADSQCGFKASYVDGKPKEAAKACASNNGTQITIEDLFFNVSTRRKAFRNLSEEHAKIVDVVNRYAVHNPAVEFSVRKHGEHSCDVKTSENSSHIDNIRTIYGSLVAKELMEITGEDSLHMFKFHGYISNTNYNVKKSNFLLFINHRLVDCSSLKNAFRNVYSQYLPKGTHPFVYISLELAPENIDVNVHPTKHEVRFLHEDLIVEKIQQKVDATLLSCDNSRTFYTQTLLPLDITSKPVSDEKTKPDKLEQKNMVRTDSTEQTLDTFLEQANNKQKEPVKESVEPKKQSDNNSNPAVKEDISKQASCNLSSVCELREEITNDCQADLKKIFQKHKFIGCINRQFALVQHETKMYLINTSSLSETLFYQIIINNFGEFGIMKLSTPPLLFDLLILALGSEDSGWTQADGPKEELASSAVELIKSKAPMLEEYFSMEINEEGKLLSLPLLLDNYVPTMEKLPMYILRLATDVDWDEEKSCFKTFALETASFYAFSSEEFGDDESEENDDWKKTVENVVYPSFRSTLSPPNRCLEDRSILQVANLPDLYKVFERC